MGRYQKDVRLANLIVEDDIGSISREMHLQLMFESIYCVLNGIKAQPSEEDPSGS